ncbi:MAG: coenzyme F420 hydrogenase [Candidatus Aminicenantes bacterium]|nr:coenzyme F420 hydrogenase [Candidatus Aminicenantes bacterium]
MAKAVKIKKKTEEGLHDFLKSLLDKEIIKGVFILKKMDKTGAVSYSLITDPEEFKKAVPLYPYMPVNAGKALANFTLLGKAEQPIAAILRPCEIRAFVELVKRTQGDFENFLIISLTCGGVLTLKTISEPDQDKLISQYWESVKKAEVFEHTREACQFCEHFLPLNADITVAAVGKKDLDEECLLFLNTPKGEKFAQEASGSSVSEEIETEKVQQLKKKREELKEKYVQQTETGETGMKSLVNVFAPCLGCHGCSHVCPICYCTLCEFDSKTLQYNADGLSSDLKRKGGLKVPSGNLLFHLGRMTHMAVSCISCGMCSDVCPVNIPVATVFSKAGKSLQKVFDYFPGKDAEEPVPGGTYKEEEFAEIGEQ